MTEYEHTIGYPMTVYRGAQLLDEAEPGWVDKIDLTRLDMADCQACILGQLNPAADRPFERGLARLNLGGSGAKYGFAVWGRQRWDDLTAYWRELIRERRARAA